MNVWSQCLSKQNISNLVEIVTELYTCKKLAPKTLTGRTQTRRQTEMCLNKYISSKMLHCGIAVVVKY